MCLGWSIITRSELVPPDFPSALLLFLLPEFYNRQALQQGIFCDGFFILVLVFAQWHNEMMGFMGSSGFSVTAFLSNIITFVTILAGLPLWLCWSPRDAAHISLQLLFEQHKQ